MTKNPIKKDIINTVVKDTVEIFKKAEFQEKGWKFKKNKKKYIVLLTIDDGNSRTIEGVKNVKATTNKIDIGDKLFPIDMSKDIYTIKNKAYYIMDMNKGQLHLDLDDTYKFNPKFLKKIVKEQIIAQTITRFTGQQVKTNMYVAFFFAIFGGLIGYIIALFSLGVI